MALRAIENSMGSPKLEKRKTPIKALSLLSQSKQLNSGITDENSDVSSVPVDPAIDYIASHDLKPVEHPESQLRSLIEGLESTDWVKICEALNNARRYALFHSPLMKPNLEKLLAVIAKAMKNPRSALCKTSIMAASDVFAAFGDTLLESESDAFDDVIMQLLLKASQDKRFVCEEADRALDAMVNSVAPPALLSKLKRYVGHSNPRVRAKAAASVANSVSMMGLEELEKVGVVVVLKMGVDLMNDRLPSAREAARRVLVSVHDACTGTSDGKGTWENLCTGSLSPIHAQAVLKLVSHD